MSIRHWGAQRRRVTHRVQPPTPITLRDEFADVEVDVREGTDPWACTWGDLQLAQAARDPHRA